MRCRFIQRAMIQIFLPPRRGKVGMAVTKWHGSEERITPTLIFPRLEGENPNREKKKFIVDSPSRFMPKGLRTLHRDRRCCRHSKFPATRRACAASSALSVSRDPPSRSAPWHSKVGWYDRQD